MYVVTGIAASMISYASGQSRNLEIFLQAARDVLAGSDLYVSTAFKYSPAFAFLFAPFLWIPPWLAAALWGTVNFVSAFYGIDAVVKDPREKRIALTAALFGIVLVTDGDQSNLLITGTMLLSFQALEDGKPWRAAWLTALGTIVKLFPALGLAFVVFDRRRARAAPAFLLFLAGLCLSPLLALAPTTLTMEYASWRRLLSREANENRGWSMMGVLDEGLHLAVPNAWVQGAGALVLAAPFVRALLRGSDGRQRLGLMASLLAFIVLFNHRSEYATLVISAVALGVWYATGARTRLHTLLLVLALVLPGPLYTVADPKLSGLSAFLGAPRRFHALRIVPLLGAWLWMQKDLLWPAPRRGLT